MFGDIDPGGRVNIVSTTPRFTPSATATLTDGSFDTRRAEMDVTGPLSATLAARIVVATEDSDGWRDFVPLRRRVVAPSLAWAPRDGVRLTYIGEITRFDAPFDRSIPAIGGDADALLRTRFFDEPADGTTRFRNASHQLTGEIALTDRITLAGGIARRTGSLRGFLSDQSRLVGGDTLWRQRRARDYTVEDVSARLQLMWDVTPRLTLSGGVRFDAYRQRIRNNRTGAVGLTIDEPVNVRLGGRYALDDRFALHANWGESFLLNSGIGRDGQGFAPERGKGYEIGMTAALPGLDIAVTGFDIAKRDILTTSGLVLPDYIKAKAAVE